MVKIIGFLAPLSTVERKAGITRDQFETTKQNYYNSVPYLLHGSVSSQKERITSSPVWSE